MNSEPDESSVKFPIEAKTQPSTVFAYLANDIRHFFSYVDGLSKILSMNPKTKSIPITDDWHVEDAMEDVQKRIEYLLEEIALTSVYLHTLDEGEDEVSW